LNNKVTSPAEKSIFLLLGFVAFLKVPVDSSEPGLPSGGKLADYAHESVL
jgi:hypothetical protein